MISFASLIIYEFQLEALTRDLESEEQATASSKLNPHDQTDEYAGKSRSSKLNQSNCLVIFRSFLCIDRSP